MRIYVIPCREKNKAPVYPKSAKKPYLSLEKDDWNDFGYVTSFHLVFHSSQGEERHIGRVKILRRDSNRTELPEIFLRLGSDFCSMGQSKEYYNALAELGDGIDQLILEALNDIVFRPLLAEGFRNTEAFEKSLLREPEAKQVFEIGRTFFESSQDYEFEFICRLSGAQRPHRIGFNFRKNGELPHRLAVLIGKNGTGKTKILAEIAEALTKRSKISTFKPKTPQFSRVFAVSYSLFDHFRISDKSSAYGYQYCGLRTESGYQSDLNFAQDLTKALEHVRKLKRFPEWTKVVEPIIPDIAEKLTKKNTLKATDLRKMSSGQVITLATLTHIVANIQADSLLLFDEPETHLHPNAISSMIKSIYMLLEAFSSYAIISTHSPLVLQEVPSRSVQVFKREGSYPVIRPLALESFGENLSTLTHEVFGVNMSESYYKTVLHELAVKLPIDEINRLFGNRLSFHARIFLESVGQEKTER